MAWVGNVVSDVSDDVVVCVWSCEACVTIGASGTDLAERLDDIVLGVSYDAADWSAVGVSVEWVDVWVCKDPVVVDVTWDCSTVLGAWTEDIFDGVCRSSGDDDGWQSLV